MALEKLNQVFDQVLVTASVALRQEETYAQIGIILAIYAVAFVLANRIRKHTRSIRCVSSSASWEV
jgi:hypothetical protein